jgi:hypothetical protein
MSAFDPLHKCCAADTSGNNRACPSTETDQFIDAKAAWLFALPRDGHAWEWNFAWIGLLSRLCRARLHWV